MLTFQFLSLQFTVCSLQFAVGSFPLEGGLAFTYRVRLCPRVAASVRLLWMLIRWMEKVETLHEAAAVALLAVDAFLVDPVY